MGIAGSMIQQDFFEEYLGMRCEAVDMSELTRRLEEQIYDREEFERAMQWVEEYCREGEDINPEGKQLSRREKDRNWETVVKMTLIRPDGGQPKTGGDRIQRGGIAT